MADISLLQLFDILGLPPRIDYTEGIIGRHKRMVTRRIAERGMQVQFVVDRTTHVYGFNSVSGAVDRILRIIQTGGLAFHPAPEPWESHWNPLGENWKEPIPEWEDHVANFCNDRCEQSKNVIKVSASLDYERRLTQASSKDEIGGLRDELRRAQLQADKHQAEVQSRDDIITQLRGTLNPQTVKERNEELEQAFQEISHLRDLNLELEDRLLETDTNCRRYQKERNALRRELDEEDKVEEELRREVDTLRTERDELSISCNELRMERDELSILCNELRMERDGLRGAQDQLGRERDQVRDERDTLQGKVDALMTKEEQRQRAFQEIDDIEDLAELGKEHQHLLAVRRRLNERVQQRLRQKQQLRSRQLEFGRMLEEKMEEEKAKEALQLILERESALYEHMDVDGDKDGDEDGDEDGDKGDFMNDETAVGSNDDLDDIPSISPQSGRTSFERPSAPTKKKRDNGKPRIKVGQIWKVVGKEKEISQSVDVWAGINRLGKIYRRCPPLGEDGKSGKTSLKHEEIQYLPKFQNLSQDLVDTLIREEVENSLVRGGVES